MNRVNLMERPEDSGLGAPPEFVMSYRPIAKGYGVERRWLDQHVEPDDKPGEPRSEDEVLAAVKRMIANLRTAQSVYSGADEEEDEGEGQT